MRETHGIIEGTVGKKGNFGIGMVLRLSKPVMGKRYAVVNSLTKGWRVPYAWTAGDGFSAEVFYEIGPEALIIRDFTPSIPRPYPEHRGRDMSELTNRMRAANNDEADKLGFLIIEAADEIERLQGLAETNRRLLDMLVEQIAHVDLGMRCNQDVDAAMDVLFDKASHASRWLADTQISIPVYIPKPIE